MLAAQNCFSCATFTERTVNKYVWTKPWTDEELYEKYSLTKSEIAFIETIVRPMDNLNGAVPDESVEDDSNDE